MVMRLVATCPIWNVFHQAEGEYTDGGRMIRIDHSERAGGGFRIESALADLVIPKMDNRHKARLTTWLINQRRQGIPLPMITLESVNETREQSDMQVSERAEGLLRFLSDQTSHIGDRVTVDRQTDGAYAWSESTDWDEIEYLIEHLADQGLLIHTPTAIGGVACQVTVAGSEALSSTGTGLGSSQAFVAMWFNQSTRAAYDHGIRQAILDCGYHAVRIDEKLDVNKIDEDIIREIRKSKFVVADFTHGSDGARGGVYFEAGFAYGLDIPVIHSCHADQINALHFDTRQYHHIAWRTPEELHRGLINRIPAILSSHQANRGRSGESR